MSTSDIWDKLGAISKELFWCEMFNANREFSRHAPKFDCEPIRMQVQQLEHDLGLIRLNKHLKNQRSKILELERKNNACDELLALGFGGVPQCGEVVIQLAKAMRKFEKIQIERNEFASRKID